MNTLYQQLLSECGFRYITQLPTLWRCSCFLSVLERIPSGKPDLREWTDVAQKLSLNQALSFENEANARTYLAG